MKVGELVKVNELGITQSYPHQVIEYIDTSSVQDGVILEYQVLSLGEAPSRARRIVRKNDILLSTVRPSLRHFAIANKPKPNTIASTGFAVITAKLIYYKYLYYFLTTKWYTDYLATIAESQQSNFPAFNPSLIEKTRITPPDFKIQKKIAAILSTYDDLIVNNNRRISILEKMAEELYREWFVRLRFPGHGKTKIIKGVPAGWEKKPISAFADEIRNGITKENLPDDERYLGSEHISQRSISVKDWATADTIDSDKLLFQDHDILFGKIRPYLHKVSLVHFSGACSSDIIVIRPKNKAYEGYLLFTVFSDTFVELATVAAKGTKMPRADWGFLKRLEVIVPEKNILETYQSHFETIHSQIRCLLQAITVLQKSRDYLLSRLMSGKIDVENLDIKFPASITDEIEVAHA